ncbi:MAG TPA: hypothetical protein VFI99_12970 [Nocardioides sp.]|nr:hypothetical protein [Nocardioides sp.]
MSENQKQIEDTEGHGIRGAAALPDERNDEATEGHMVEEESDETEGHGARFNGALPEEGDDEGTEGHAGSRNF